MPASWSASPRRTILQWLLPSGDDPACNHPLAGVAFQREWERRAFRGGDGTYAAPVQLVGDLLAGKASRRLGDVEPSDRPGVRPGALADCLPRFAIEAMQEALRAFDRDIPGFCDA